MSHTLQGYEYVEVATLVGVHVLAKKCCKCCDECAGALSW